MSKTMPFSIFFFLICLMNSTLAMTIMSLGEPNQNSWLQYLASLFPLESGNVGKMASAAMTSTSIDNRTLIDLYNEAYEIVNVTGADSVLLQMDPKGNSSNNKSGGGAADSKNNSLVVLAVAKPNVPTHEDLMKKFNIYFVNLTESPIPSFNESDLVEEESTTTTALPYSHPTMWQIFVDFIRNQANAIVGAMMIPINVSADAILKSTQTHAEYVMSGSSVGSVVSAPIILKSISIPNIVSQKITDLASHQVNNVDALSQQAKTLTDGAIQMTAHGLNNGTDVIQYATNQYVIRPIGAFTGFQLNNVGSGIQQIGDTFTTTGINIRLFGERLGSNAVKVVSAGATAIAWGLDNTVSFGQK